jgi:hypothetical protein
MGSLSGPGPSSVVLAASPNAAGVVASMELEDLLRNPSFLLRTVNVRDRTISFIETSEAAIRRDDFHGCLDRKDELAKGATCNLDEALEAWADLPDRFASARFIFMTDFCGSTLLWRALRGLPGVMGLNELDALADLSDVKRAIDRLPDAFEKEQRLRDWERVLRVTVGLTGRTYRSTDVVIIKEWPLANYIISDVLRCEPCIRAVFLYGDRRDYMNAVFRRPERRRFVRHRVLSLAETDRWPAIHERKHTFSDAQMAAAHWFVQQRAFLAIDSAASSQIRSLDAARLYRQGRDIVWNTARHLGLTPARADVETAYSEVAKWHSKSRVPTPYSLAAREEEILKTQLAHGREIGEALEQLAEWESVDPIPDPLPWPLPDDS